MKDLITSIGAIMILMVFVMQFCSNQVITSRILLADMVIDNIQQEVEQAKENVFSNNRLEEYKKDLASCFDCSSSEVSISKDENRIIFRMPIKNVVACGELLGISSDVNISTYTREVLVE